MSIWPKHGELRGSDRYDRPSMAWVRADEWQARQWEREDRVFAKQRNQGEVCCPQIVTDTVGSIHGIQSMGNGQWYDSKSELRKHYKRDGFLEVGNEVRTPTKPPRDRKGLRDALGKAMAEVKEMPVETLKARAAARGN
jgi:hypothetical protein